jgi:hypothetical protein
MHLSASINLIDLHHSPIYNQGGEFGISGIDPDQTVQLIIFVIIFFSGVGVIVKGFI